MKKLFILFASAVLATACGNSSDTSAKKETEAAPSNAASASDKGLELIGASDCTTCHRLDKDAQGSNIGPAYSEVAAKYAPAADTTINRLVHKIISGGSGVWGTTPMTPHAALSEADVKEMVSYILTLKK